MPSSLKLNIILKLVHVMNYKLLTFFIFLSSINLCADFWPSNLFDASNILFNLKVPSGRFIEWNVIPEIPVKLKPYTACNDDNKAIAVNNALHIWQPLQNLQAASSTIASSSEFSSFLTNNPKAEVKGSFHIPINLMFSVRFPLGSDFYLGFYLPFMTMKLHHIRWTLPNSQSAENDATLQNVLDAFDAEGTMKLRSSWNRAGVGDLTSMVGWLHTFIQERPWLREVLVGIRAGAIFPTGKKEDLTKVFALPFGHDGGVGILAGGTLELNLKEILKWGLDVQFTHFFGIQGLWRYKYAAEQTDLLLLNYQCTVHDPGFSQFYTLWMKLTPFYWLDLMVAYQHMHHHDGELLLNQQVVTPTIVESAERLQEWTTHSLLGLITVDFRERYDKWYLPSFTFFAKYGLRGHRSLLFDTVGLQISFSY